MYYHLMRFTVQFACAIQENLQSSGLEADDGILTKGSALTLTESSGRYCCPGVTLMMLGCDEAWCVVNNIVGFSSVCGFVVLVTVTMVVSGSKDSSFTSSCLTLQIFIAGPIFSMSAVLFGVILFGSTVIRIASDSRSKTVDS